MLLFLFVTAFGLLIVAVVVVVMCGSGEVQL